MASVETNELTGTALDWAVGYARSASMVSGDDQLAHSMANHIIQDGQRFSTDYKLGSQLIDEAGIATRRDPKSGIWYAMAEADAGSGTIMHWSENSFRGGARFGKLSYQVHPRRMRFNGDTRLVAGLRCYVGSIVGATIDLPERLTEAKTDSAALDLVPGNAGVIETQQIPILSTAHMPSSHAGAALESKLFDVAEYTYGVFVYSQYFTRSYDDRADAPDDIEEWIKPIAEFMRQHNLGAWLRFDADGSVVNELPQYDW